MDGQIYCFSVYSKLGRRGFFAGQNHVATQIIASYLEDQIITTKPEQILEQKQ